MRPSSRCFGEPRYIALHQWSLYRCCTVRSLEAKFTQAHCRTRKTATISRTLVKALPLISPMSEKLIYLCDDAKKHKGKMGQLLLLWLLAVFNKRYPLEQHQAWDARAEAVVQERFGRASALSTIHDWQGSRATRVGLGELAGLRSPFPAWEEHSWG